MQNATCASCGSAFEVDFAPGTEFTCGGCGPAGSAVVAESERREAVEKLLGR